MGNIFVPWFDNRMKVVDALIDAAGVLADETGTDYGETIDGMCNAIREPFKTDRRPMGYRRIVDPNNIVRSCDVFLSRYFKPYSPHRNQYGYTGYWIAPGRANRNIRITTLLLAACVAESEGL